MRCTITVIAMAFSVIVSLTAAAVAQNDSLKVTYQGFLTDDSGNAVQNGTYQLIFRVYEEAIGGTPLAMETRMVDVTNGLFSTLLESFAGSVVNDLLFPPGAQPRKLYFEIQVEGDPPLSPRIELGTVPYSIVSQRMSGDIITAPGQLIVSGPDPTIMIVQSVDSGMGASMEIAFDDEGLAGARCDKKSVKFEAIRTDDFGDTTGMAVLSVDTAAGPGMVLGVDDEWLLEARCDKKKATFQAIHANEFGDTTGMVAQSVDSGGVTLIGEEGNDIYSTVLDGESITTQAIQINEFGDTTGMITQSVGSGGVTLLGEEGDDIYSTVLDGESIATRAIRINEFGDTTGMIAQSVGSGGVTLLGEEGDGIYSTVLDGESITTSYEYDALNRLAIKVDSDGAKLTFHDAPSGDTAAILNQIGLEFIDPLDVVYYYGSQGLAFHDGAGDTTVSISPDGIIMMVNYLTASAVRIDEPAGMRRPLRYNTDGVRRFEAAVNQTAETGSDAGSDYVITRFGDTGAPLAAALFIERSTGNVGINTTTPGYMLDVQGSIGGTGGLYHASDRRLKRDVQTLDNAMDKVSRLRGVSFTWRSEEYHRMNLPAGRRLGLVAQEVEEVLPEVVNTDGDGFKAVEYSSIAALLIEGMKEQQQTIDGQHKKIDALQAQVAELTAMVQALAAARSGSDQELAANR